MELESEVAVFDNVLSENDFSCLQSVVMSQDFPWYYSRKTREDEVVSNFYLYGWLHMIFKEGRWHTHEPHLFINSINSVLTRAGENRFEVFRARLVMNTIAPQALINGAHVDSDMPHRTALFYINDSDGDTILYDQFLSGAVGPKSVHQTITPVANRLVCFDGLRYHSGTLPTSTARRIVLNVNYRPL